MGLLKTRLLGVEFYGCHQKTQKHLSRLRDEVVYGEDNTTWYSSSNTVEVVVHTSKQTVSLYKVMWEVVSSRKKPLGTC